MLQNNNTLTQQWPGPSPPSRRCRRSAACRWRLWTESEPTAWWTSDRSPETGSRTYGATPVRTKRGVSCALSSGSKRRFLWACDETMTATTVVPIHCLVTGGGGVWGVKRKEEEEIETRWLQLTWRHSRSLITLAFWQPRWGGEGTRRKNWRPEN